MPKAKALEHERDIAHDRHNSYQVAEAAFQLGIVLCSIAIVARVLWLVFLGAGLGFVGVLSLLNGFFLFLKVGH
jgi:ABC-type nickel/cobalt efflux system permease component RcnA